MDHSWPCDSGVYSAAGTGVVGAGGGGTRCMGYGHGWSITSGSPWYGSGPVLTTVLPCFLVISVFSGNFVVSGNFRVFW